MHKKFTEHWFKLNEKEYGHSPFNWGKKQGKQINDLLSGLEKRKMDPALIFKAADHYFSLKGFEKTNLCHNWGSFFVNFQKYLQPVLPSVQKKVAEVSRQMELEKANPNALRNMIEKRGPGYLKELRKGRKFMPRSQYEQAVKICMELYPEAAKAFLSQNLQALERNTVTRKDDLLKQAKLLLEN